MVTHVILRLSDGENRLIVAQDGMGKMCEENKEVQTSGCKISHGDILFCLVAIVNNIVYYIFEDC